MQYKVICQRHLCNVEVMVNLSIKEGWAPVGGISCMKTELGTEPIFDCVTGSITLHGELKESSHMWAQAMIYKEGYNEISTWAIKRR